MLEIFQYDFMLRAFVAGFIISILAPSIGIFLVVKRYSLLTDTLSHVSLVGVALGLLAGINPIITAIGVSVVAALGMEKLRHAKKIFGESILTLFLSGGLALSLIIFGLSRGLNVNIFTYLFGSITTVSAGDLRLMGGFGFVIIIIIYTLFKRFFITAYDEELAQANGLPIKFLNLTLMILAAVTISISMRIVGALLVGALMVIPVLAATQFGKSFLKTFFYSVGISILSVTTGLFASFYLNLPTGATIVMSALILFVISLAINKKS
ncbi:MAG: metal ABC transporter permease [Candidatus Magasanikbacteria bacterium RIFOXYD2_FULL_39_9]|uniref:Metal ABC transporter permease n=1 Tax=Candidatus Magasanikbacteria bacterium RIFOXYD1_FULL_40_23 TaxID=1798705 RepID=A0A1F6P7E5_9BACT|nr:MAG: metal ABC transporter permease [Candidatus Magasanikbacteria bacterium RIFOXYD1_FULL_40_23]OGH92166.1 MAG: metal ABC transporter permease [Candidatus Magasanikbacteria bacterium RIFOXYD2_FULL_39_9]